MIFTTTMYKTLQVKVLHLKPNFGKSTLVVLSTKCT